MKNKNIYILLDLSEYSKYQLQLANQWALWFNMDLIIVHRLPKMIPSLADPDLRLKVKKDLKQEKLQELKNIKQELIDAKVNVRFELTSQPLTTFLEHKFDPQKLELIAIGLKGTGKLEQIFLGSTATRIINDLNQITIALPNKEQEIDPKILMVAIHPKFHLNEDLLQVLLSLIMDRIKEVKFFSVVNHEEQYAETKPYLEHLAKKFGKVAKCSTLQFEGKDAFKEIKSYFQNSENSFLVVQKGSRSFSDQLFRKFMINELVYDASIPLLILPL